jgi:hypothetical protein
VKIGCSEHLHLCPVIFISPVLHGLSFQKGKPDGTTKIIFRIMKTFLTGIFALLILPVFFTSCGDEDTEIIDSSLPQGAFTASRSGTLTPENGTPTAGTVEVGTDEDNTPFLHFGSNFKTELGTGTVTVYFSKSVTFQADPGNGNPNLRLVGIISKNGEQYMKLNSTPGNDFTHLILWCGSANIPFGNAALN